MVEKPLTDLPYNYHKDGLAGYLGDKIRKVFPDRKFVVHWKEDDSELSSTLYEKRLFKRKKLVLEIFLQETVVNKVYLGPRICVYDRSVVDIVRDSLRSCIWRDKVTCIWK